MANKLSKNEIKHVAKLANLHLEDSEIRNFQKDLSNILSYIDKLQELDTKNVPITSQVTGLVNVYHQDQVVPERMLSQKQALQNATHTEKGYVVVPAVINKN